MIKFSDKELEKLISGIKGADSEAMSAAKKRQAELAKPPGSLGRLEDLAVKVSGITGKIHNELDKKALLVFCADNGVAVEGVSSAPQSVTRAQTVNLARGKTGAAVLSKAYGCRLYVCDVGVLTDIDEPGVINIKIAHGTGNIAKGPAMTREQTLAAIKAGADLASTAVRDGAKVMGVGEMGIGNTTTSSAVLAALTGLPVEKLTGRGGGLTDEAFAKKTAVIKKALAVNDPDKNDPVDVLSKVGGLDIAAMTGAFLGAARLSVPAVIDGFISVVAALCAARLCPRAADYMIPSHRSFEIGYLAACRELGLEPLFDLRMRLGEGSGCPIAMSILDAACRVQSGMATFSEASICDDYLDPIRKTDAFTVKEKK